ncbi:hypothetical protein MTR_2g436910 [Medicago truncatula]|uniref:Uncharacterized protein n=1 Tax=Medicago truncatula TaxID=3880 RepID=A0A072V623_MEDTR|nr:hypothetical protein MTR_2g436910 [Medicago truncatula]
MVQMVDNFTAMLFDLLDRLTEHQRLTTAMTLWSLWKSRNLKLWEYIDTTPVPSYLVPVMFTASRAECKRPDNIFSWRKPPNGVIKCNVDASIFNNNSMVVYMVCAFEIHWGKFYLENHITCKFLLLFLKWKPLGC